MVRIREASVTARDRVEALKPLTQAGRRVILKRAEPQILRQAAPL